MSTGPKAINLINTEGQVMKDDSIMADMFNNFFASIFTRDGGLLPPLPSVSLVITPMPEVVFSDIKILSKLRALKETLACGHDAIYSSVLKHAAIALTHPLCQIFY